MASVLVYDGDCGMCTKTAAFAANRLRPSRGRYAVTAYQDADLVAFLYREDVYRKPEERDGTAEVISPDGIVTVGTYDEVVLSPDGHSVITTGDGVTELRTTDELELSDPIDLTGVVGTNSLLAFVPD